MSVLHTRKCSTCCGKIIVQLHTTHNDERLNEYKCPEILVFSFLYVLAIDRFGLCGV